MVGLVGTLALDATDQPGGRGREAAEQAPEQDPAVPESPPDAADEAPEEAAGERTRLNLLGEVDSESGEARRNENVRLTLIDNNVLKELLQRMGTTASIIKTFSVENSYFGLEFGGNPTPSPHLRPAPADRPHGELFWTHQNSAVAARSFFQVGGVQPARTNDYGLTAALPLRPATALTVRMSQRKLRGQVNGNVLVPAADERSPTSSDPAKRALVERILGAFPDELPNRTDINERALNTNAPQNIDNDRISATLDNSLGVNRLTAQYNVTLQQVEAFQLVGGQNPDTTTKNHHARLTWRRAWTPATESELSAGYERIGSLLVSEETSLGTFYLFSRILQSIGPSSSIPIDRAQNLFRYGARATTRKGSHQLVLGAEALRKQVNGFESNDHRGTFSFRADFGRNAVQNLLAGAPSQFRFAIGNAHRGFRNWSWLTYLGDTWKAAPNLDLHFGLRWEPVLSPTEVDGLSEVPYDGDWNNFAPNLGFAYRLPAAWGVLRAAYGLHYGQIFNATFLQARFNQPGVLSVVVNAADLLDPLRDFAASDLDPTARSNFIDLDRELSIPYSHQYNFAWAFDLSRDWAVELGYVGSRSHRLLNLRYTNRGQPVEGIPQITRTVNQRRADQRYYDVLRVVNGSIGYYDAAKASVRAPNWAGLSLDVSYWWSKAIDLGSNYTNTATGRDGRNGRSPNEFDVWGYMKGPSDFDQPHALMGRVSYATPRIAGLRGVARAIATGWQLSSAVLLKSGTPFSVRSGSDSPGVGNVDGAGSDRPDVLDPDVLGLAADHPDTAGALLRREAFAFIEPTSPGGNLGRNTFRKDRVWNINFAVSKRFLLPRKSALLVRAESLNFLNHPQFAEPDINLASRTFGAITNTLNDGRAFRATVRYSF